MSALFWHFVFYSFFGYLVEKLFAFAVRSPHRVRRCFLVLPLCPVYGLGMLAVLAAPEFLLHSPLLPLWGTFAATAVEYTMHLFYERALGVRFWDYTGQPGNLGGRVCLRPNSCAVKRSHRDSPLAARGSSAPPFPLP